MIVLLAFVVIAGLTGCASTPPTQPKLTLQQMLESAPDEAPTEETQQAKADAHAKECSAEISAAYAYGRAHGYHKGVDDLMAAYIEKLQSQAMSSSQHRENK